MKRVRTEQIQMAVSCYLKRRQYGDADGPLKQGLRLSQSAEEMATSLAGTTHPRPGGSVQPKCLSENPPPNTSSCKIPWALSCT